MNLFQLKWRGLALAVFVLILAFSGCKKDDDDPVAPGGNNNTGGMSASVTLNGDGFNNKNLSFTFAGGGYYTVDQFTVIAFTGADSTNAVLGFKGNQAGTYAFSVDTDGEPENGMTVVSGSSAAYTSLTTGSIKITEYGNVGSYIKGTFSGTLINAYNPQKSITVSGSFSALRAPDEDYY